MAAACVLSWRGEGALGELGGKGDEVVFARGEVEELDAGVLEAHDLVPLLRAPQDHALSMESAQVRAMGRPRDVGLRHVLETRSAPDARAKSIR